jgi:hypothetical protein
MGMLPSLEEAIDRAQRTVPEGNALTNVAVYYQQYLYVLLVRTCFRFGGM